MKTKTILLCMLLILLVASVQAVTYCDTSSVSQTWQEGESTSKIITCTNQNNSTSVTMNKVGSYFSTSPTIPVTLLPLTPRAITIIFDSSAPAGTYDGILYFSDDSDPILVNMNVTESTAEETGCVIEVFPESLPNIKISQGETKTKSIKITVPSCYSTYIKVNGVSLATDEQPIQLGELALGNIQPGSSLNIPVDINAEDVSTGQYLDTLQFSIYDSSGNRITVPTVDIGVYVTTGVTPITGDTFSTPPTCSLSATSLNLNNTYSFTCSGLVSNLDINIPSSEYYTGTKVEVSSSLYRYDFTPAKYGETKFVAEFKYKGASIFQPFSQDIRITSAGSLVAGTTLKFIFTPKIDEATGDEDKFLVQIVDNKTGSLVSSPRIWVNAVEINSSTDTFEYKFIPNTNYEIRGKASGYEDLVQTINIKPQKINILINPGTGDSSTMFNVTTSVENATLTIQGQTYTASYYGVLPGGTVEIKAVKEGYKTEIINFTVTDKPKILSFGGEFKKNVDQNFTLNKDGNWVVYYKKTMDATDRSEYAKGYGSLVAFKPEKAGAYVIEVDGIHVGTFEIAKFSFKNKWGPLPAWGWLVGGAVILLIIIIAIARRNAQKAYSSMADGAGLSFNVGDN
jgi:hypothetical protein